MSFMTIEFPISRYTVSGHSMLPTLKPGQDVFTLNWFIDVKAGDIIVFQKADKCAVKRVRQVEGRGFKVEGDNLKDSKDFGLVKKSEVLGKVIWY